MSKTDKTGDIAVPNEILRSLVGSELHGLALPGSSDRDEMGIFVEPPENVIGLAGPCDQHVWRSKAAGERSGSGDEDLTIYSLRKYLRLAVQGNPTVLLPLYAPEDDLLCLTPLGVQLRTLAPQIVSREAGERFYGYLIAQRERVTGGGKRSRVPNRPELIERWGFDVKFASHALRLALQGVEIMTTGRLTLPMREEDRVAVLAVKSGQVPFAEALARIDQTAEKLRIILDDPVLSPLPEHPDFDTLNTWSIHAHQQHWRATQ